MVMPFAAALSIRPETSAALDEVCTALSGQLPRPDLAVAFFTPHHARAAEVLSQGLKERLNPRALIGTIGESVIGNDREVEGTPALSVWLGQWASASRISVEAFHLHLERTSEGFSLLGWPDELVGA